MFNDDISPSKLIKYLEAETGERILPNETLIILDEIQSCERAVTSLKYFCEEAPEYHIFQVPSSGALQYHHLHLHRLQYRADSASARFCNSSSSNEKGETSTAPQSSD